MAQLTRNGYLLKTQNEWYAEERDLYTNIDPLWNLDTSTPDGLKIAHDAEIFSALDEQLLLAYSSKDPNKAFGIDLDVISALTGTTRGKGTYSTVELVLQCQPGSAVYVPAGKRVRSDSTGETWEIVVGCYSDPSTGVATCTGVCERVGQVQADAGTITRIVDNVGGWVSVNNPVAAVAGLNVESDSSLRIKRAIAVGRPSNCQVDSMTGEIFAVNGVNRVKVFENDTGETDENGLPPHSIAPVVNGGTDEDVAMAIYLKKSAGVLLHPAGAPVIIDVTSPTYPPNVKRITFSRPIYVDIHLDIKLKNDGTLPPDIESLIRDSFMEFAAGDLIPAEYGFKVAGFDIGEDVPYSTMYTPINKVLGGFGNSSVSELKLNGGVSDIPILFNQLSNWNPSNISVSVL